MIVLDAATTCAHTRFAHDLSGFLATAANMHDEATCVQDRMHVFLIRAIVQVHPQRSILGICAHHHNSRIRRSHSAQLSAIHYRPLPFSTKYSERYPQMIAILLIGV